MDQSESGPDGTEPGFEQAFPDAGDFGEVQMSDLAESSPLGRIQNVDGEASSGPEFGGNSAMILGLPVMMKVVLGSAKMPVATLAKLAKGSVVKLDKMVGDPVDILVNGRLIARGEVVVLNEGTSRFGVVLTQVGALAGVSK
jgi:flagellar motor switch protein FliN/FliY